MTSSAVCVCSKGGHVSVQEQPGLVVLVIELENALAHMHTTVEPSKMWSPYREPLAKFLNKYTVEVGPKLPCCHCVLVQIFAC